MAYLQKKHRERIGKPVLVKDLAQFLEIANIERDPKVCERIIDELFRHIAHLVVEEERMVQIKDFGTFWPRLNDNSATHIKSRGNTITLAFNRGQTKNTKKYIS